MRYENFNYSKYFLSAAIILVFLGCTNGLLTVAEQKQILMLHNRYRSITIPPASNMKELTWDHNLARIAQSYSEKCIFKHNKNRTIEGNGAFTYVGENLYASDGYKYPHLHGVKIWYDEIAFYDFFTLKCKENEQCGHFLALTWAETESVGCGISQCDELIGTSICNGRQCSHLVCNYSPGVNTKTVPPYKSGSRCSDCPEGFNHCSNGLCSREIPESKDPKNKF